MNKILFILILLFALGCDKDEPVLIEDETEMTIIDMVDLSQFEEIDDSIMFLDLKLNDNYDYFELRVTDLKGISDTRHYVIYSFGDKCLSASDSALCFNQMDTMYVENGFHEFRGLAWNKKSIITIKGDSIRIWDSFEAVQNLLGSINSKSDALLLAYADGYFYEYYDKEKSAIRTTDNGYRVIALKLIWNCPAQSEKYLINISTSGLLQIIKQELLETPDDFCID